MTNPNSISRRAMLAASVAAALGAAVPVKPEASGIDFGSGSDFSCTFIAYVDKNGKVAGARIVQSQKGGASA